MRIVNQSVGYIMGMFLILTLMVSCAVIPELTINYRLPPESDELKGEKVYLVFEDIRESKDIMGRGARKDFKGFSGSISFSLARNKEDGFKIGSYDLRALCLKAFKSKLENLGVAVVSERKNSRSELVFVINEFYLDLVERKWIAKMGYEARLVKDGKICAKQMISGQAERLKIIGHAQADTVMGEIFTDIVNKLDVGKLFRQANSQAQ